MYFCENFKYFYMKNVSLFSLILLLLLSCTPSSASKKTSIDTKKTRNISTDNSKKKIGASNTYEKLLAKSFRYANFLNFDLAYIRRKGLPDKKYFAEFLGIYLKFQKAGLDKKIIHKRLLPFYEKTLKPNFHNMAKVNDKLFKKNSMSYMRIMWLLKELDFDISYYQKEFSKIKKRMDKHLAVRGEWQKVVFDKYYDFFKLEKPAILKNAKNLKGPIATQQKYNSYNRNKTYELTHFIFAAYDYGKKTSQSRFSMVDLVYLQKILPQLIKKFERKNNDDLVSELLTCQVLLGNVSSTSFKNSYIRILSRQNNDGSFGSYEKYRKKVGKDVEFRAYLHTTLVATELFVEYNFRYAKN